MEIPVEGTPAGIVKVGTSMGWKSGVSQGIKVLSCTIISVL